jgi:hypothetical protein
MEYSYISKYVSKYVNSVGCPLLKCIQFLLRFLFACSMIVDDDEQLLTECNLLYSLGGGDDFPASEFYVTTFQNTLPFFLFAPSMKIERKE